MLALAPLSFLGALTGAGTLGGLAAGALGAARTARALGEGLGKVADFAAVLDQTDLHGNGWLTRADAFGQGLISGSRLIVPDEAAEKPGLTFAGTETTASAAIPADDTPGALPGSQNTLAPTTGLWPERPTVEAIRASYTALRAAR